MQCGLGTTTSFFAQMEKHEKTLFLVPASNTSWQLGRWPNADQHHRDRETDTEKLVHLSQEIDTGSEVVSLAYTQFVV